MGDKITKSPNIRFAGFTDAWEQRKFEKVFSHIKNNALSRDKLNYESGYAMNVHYGDVLIKFGEYLDVKKAQIPMISDENVVAKYKDSFLKNGDIIIADAAEDETVGKCCEIIGLENERVLSGLHTIPCRPNWKFEALYLGYYMNSFSYHNQLLPLMQGTKVNSISKTVLKNTYVNYPKNKEEQAKIGEFFQQLDTLITLHQRKLDLLKVTKKSMLQKMFPKDGESVPEIRFKEFTDDWEQRKLGDVVVRVTRKNKDLESTLPLTISAQDGLIDQNEFFNKTVASRDVSGYYLVKNGEFAYNKSYSKGYPWGAVKRLDRYEMGVLSTLYIVFKPTDIDSDFLSKYYDGDNWHKEVSKHAAEGARNHGLLNIAASDFFETELTIPLSKNEQKQIGVLFKNLDNLITLHQRELDLLKDLKKSMLQQMFI